MNKKTDNGLQTLHIILKIERHWKLGMETNVLRKGKQFLLN